MGFLPLPISPFQMPASRDLLPSERREFVHSHRTCIFGYARRVDGPAMSVVYYAPTDDGELWIGTTAERAKVKAVERSGKVSLFVLNEQWPVSGLQVYCDAVTERDPDLVIETMMQIAARRSGEPVGPDARPTFEQAARDEPRAVLRCRPYETFAMVPRHSRGDDERATHWPAGTIPWDATDPPEEI